MYDNQMYSSYRVIRRLQGQVGEFAPIKLVRLLKREVLDVTLDVCPNSLTFVKHTSIMLRAETNPQLFIYNFSVLGETGEVFHKRNNFYHNESEVGNMYNDSKLNIDWLIPTVKESGSDKDLILNVFSSFKS